MKFTFVRETERNPVGCIPSPGQKAKIEFKIAKAMIGYGVVYAIQKLEKAN
jgi:hypothetical protein